MDHKIIPTFITLIGFFSIALFACLPGQKQVKDPRQSGGSILQEPSPLGSQDTSTQDPTAAGSFHNPAPCQLCHESDRPSPTHHAGVDCVGCHSYPEWQTAVSSFNHDPTPESCLTCHAEDRPEAPHPVDGDCVSCHSYPNFKNLIGAASFNHEPKPEACEGCHNRPAELGARAYPNQGPPVDFDANDPLSEGGGHYRGKDCLACHQTPAEGATGFSFNHSQPRAEFCLPCHFNDGAAEHNGNNVMLSSFGNCFMCHQNFDQNANRNWGRNGAGGDDDD